MASCWFQLRAWRFGDASRACRAIVWGLGFGRPGGRYTAYWLNFFGSVMLSGMMANHAGAVSMMPQQRLVAERRWRLGIHSRSHPSAIVAEVLRGLKHLDIYWKKGGPYNFKCRKELRGLGALSNRDAMSCSARQIGPSVS
jgi:hypothetical protein